MIALRAGLPEQYKQLPDDVLFDGILKQMIQQVVLAEMLGEPTRAETLTLQNQDAAVRASMMIDRLLAQEVTDADLKAAYDEKYAGAAPETEYHAAHILVGTEDEAKAIEEQLKTGGDFAAIAKEKSKDPGSGANGGDLGWFGLGMMVPEFEQAVVALKPGEISAPVQTQFGWHVIKLEDTRVKAAPTLDSVKDELTQAIRDKKVQDAISAATAKADVKETSDGIDKAVLKNEDLLK
jgi:peptidyl-prolyl cis-trans isomerase C